MINTKNWPVRILRFSIRMSHGSQKLNVSFQKKEKQAPVKNDTFNEHSEFKQNRLLKACHCHLGGLGNPRFHDTSQEERCQDMMTEIRQPR